MAECLFGVRFEEKKWATKLLSCKTDINMEKQRLCLYRIVPTKEGGGIVKFPLKNFHQTPNIRQATNNRNEHPPCREVQSKVNVALKFYLAHGKAFLFSGNWSTHMLVSNKLWTEIHSAASWFLFLVHLCYFTPALYSSDTKEDATNQTRCALSYATHPWRSRPRRSSCPLWNPARCQRMANEMHAEKLTFEKSTNKSSQVGYARWQNF